MSEYEFEVENAKALLAAEKCPKKRRALLARLQFYQQQLDRVRQHEGRRDEPGR